MTSPAGRALWRRLLSVCLLAALCCLWLYRWDNKYAHPGPRAMNGALVLDERLLAEYPAFYLIDGWAYYPGLLLTPEELIRSEPKPDEYIYIGKYGGFDAGDAAASPHGSASYRLTISVPETPRAYALELPEIFSAYRLYVNGRLRFAMGETGEPPLYRPETGNRVVAFEAGGRVDLLLAVSDYSHLYSGMVYPPAFGNPDAVVSLLNTRLVLRCLLCFVVLAVGLLSLLIGLSRGGGVRLPSRLFGLLCLLFIGYAGYPIWKTLTAGFYPMYAVENLCFCGMLLVVILLQRALFPPGDGRRDIGLYAAMLGGAVCVSALALHLTLPLGNLALMRAYSIMISAYEWMVAGYITLTSIVALILRKDSASPLLYGILIFDAALIMDRVLPMYEPMVGGWFIELSSFALVVCVGVMIGREAAAQYHLNAILEERAITAERMGEMRESYYAIIQKQASEARAARHDLRHHLTVIGGFVSNKQYRELAAYAAEYGNPTEHAGKERYCDNATVNVLAHYYSHLAQKHDISLTLRLDIPKAVPIADTDLSGVLSNLLDNAVDACLRTHAQRRYISLSAALKAAALHIHMENSADTAIKPSAGGLSSKGASRRGYGLSSVRIAANKYNGEAAFSYDRQKQVYTSTVMLTF